MENCFKIFCKRQQFIIAFCRKLEFTEPFERKIHPEELWLYKNPRKEDYVPTNVLWVFFI